MCLCVIYGAEGAGWNIVGVVAGLVGLGGREGDVVAFHPLTLSPTIEYGSVRDSVCAADSSWH